MAEPDFIPVAQDARLVGDEALTVEVGPVPAVLIDQMKGTRVTADNRRMTAGDAFINAFAIGQVDDWRIARVGINSPHCEFGDLGGIEREGFIKTVNFYDQVHVRTEASRPPTSGSDFFLSVAQHTGRGLLLTCQWEAAAGTRLHRVCDFLITAV